MQKRQKRQKLEPISFSGGGTQSETESCERYGLRPEVVRSAMDLFKQGEDPRSVTTELEAQGLIERKAVTTTAVQHLLAEYYRDDILRLYQTKVSSQRIKTALKDSENVDIGLHAIRDCIKQGPRPGRVVRNGISGVHHTVQPSTSPLKLANRPQEEPTHDLVRWACEGEDGSSQVPAMNSQNSQNIFGSSSYGRLSSTASPPTTLGAMMVHAPSKTASGAWNWNKTLTAPTSQNQGADGLPNTPTHSPNATPFQNAPLEYARYEPAVGLYAAAEGNMGNFTFGRILEEENRRMDADTAGQNRSGYERC